jgi:hypothetical protein
LHIFAGYPILDLSCKCFRAPFGGPHRREEKPVPNKEPGKKDKGGKKDKKKKKK